MDDTQKTIAFTVTKEQHMAIKIAAIKAGLTAKDFVARIVLGAIQPTETK